jgi:hypothetical protein
LSIIQGPFSITKCQILISRFATFSSLYYTCALCWLWLWSSSPGTRAATESPRASYTAARHPSTNLPPLEKVPLPNGDEDAAVYELSSCPWVGVCSPVGVLVPDSEPALGFKPRLPSLLRVSVHAHDQPNNPACTERTLYRGSFHPGFWTPPRPAFALHCALLIASSPLCLSIFLRRGTHSESSDTRLSPSVDRLLDSACTPLCSARSRLRCDR